ncbi:hypothetical protein FA95DRAFT_1488198 [Auriscalpium vulgare]|uniref:Uncharacterized protein n=1 Tax=Auriscalpium vulgare TaxID=40419 RepID=A0ACB8S0L4_9AGAM|nr:hypothetical protein FA95DRAFT_1488198 [Auriscalpium vulgare]
MNILRRSKALIAHGRANSTLAGTVPMHTSYMLLHQIQSPREFPPRVDSPLGSDLASRARRWGGLVNFAWQPDLDCEDKIPTTHHALRDGSEVYAASVFTPGHARLHFEDVSDDNIDEVSRLVRARVRAQKVREPNLEDNAVYLYVCTHGARDCRCGEEGTRVADALREEIARRRSADPSGPYGSFVVGEVGHVGGHQYAANLLVFPRGDWFGMLRPENVPAVLDSLVLANSSSVQWSTSVLAESSPLRTFWRGRAGLDKEEQLQLYQSYGSLKVPQPRM